ncbi:MAG: cupin domain-containing protein [Nitrososphaera sp.]
MSAARQVHFGSIPQTAPDSSMSKYFTGRVEIRKMVSDLQSREAEMFLVTFYGGARTKLHFHDSDQILLATEGSGLVAVQSKASLASEEHASVDFVIRQLQAGDFVMVPAGLWHWHGAKDEGQFAHYQVKRPGSTTWLED